jgi:hypothetical protein
LLATYTPDVLTPMSFELAAEAMRAALRAQLESAPSEPALALALAKTALETGRWQKIHCFNWGNIKASPKYEGMYTCFGCDEVFGNKRVWFDPDTPYDPSDPLALPNPRFPKPPLPPGNPQTRFRAYANRFDGAYQYVEFVASGRYVDAWKELLEGNARGYVSALKRKNYFTADEGDYVKAVISLQSEMLKRLQGVLPPLDQRPDFDFEQLRAAVVRQRFDDVGIVLDETLRSGLEAAEPRAPKPPTGGENVS